MTVQFYKYQGTGNDFVIIDNRSLKFDKNDAKAISLLCDRRFGIGADGLILLEKHDTLDFNMVYFNADGNESSMCGNGGRCISAFAKFIGIVGEEATFEAIDGKHEVKIKGDLVKLLMQDVSSIENHKTHLFLDTGSPHHVEFVDDIEALDVKSKGASIRYGEPYNEVGSNVNFVKRIDDDRFKVRTYERGVEDETLSCGTGVTAVALAMHNSGVTKATSIVLETKGGDIQVDFSPNGIGYHSIWLIGEAKQVFSGKIS